jgi:molybdopterin synthase sulfur carrier subunit
MHIKYFAFFREITHEARREWSQPTATVEDLLRQLGQQYGAAFECKVFDQGGRLSTDVIILVNGRDIHHLDGTRTTLQLDDTVCIFPIVAGG